MNPSILLCFALFFWNVSHGNSLSGRMSIHFKRLHPCATVSCHFNALCVVDPDTGEPFCKCRIEQCDTAPYFPICSEGITFKSPCHASMYMCQVQRRIAQPHEGVCGEMDCGPTNPCSYYGVCESGTCKCKPCSNTTIDEFDGASLPIKPVCGSDRTIHKSECHLKYESCTSRKNIKIADEILCRTEHVKHWISDFQPAAEIGELVDFKSSRSLRNAEECDAYELRGCLPANHPRLNHLGIYTKVPFLRKFRSHVYSKVTNVKSGTITAYLSRFQSKNITNGSWIIGSKVGSGRGWFGVADSSFHPKDVTGMWYSTTGFKSRPWQPEPTVELRCVGRRTIRKHRLNECGIDELSGRYVNNIENTTSESPMFKLEVTDEGSKDMDTYNPGQQVSVNVVSLDQRERFSTLYLAMMNDIDECGVPHLSRHARKFNPTCNDQLVTRNAKRLRKAIMGFKMPVRGCVRFSALVKSTNSEIFYDLQDSDSDLPIHLTKTICPKG